uniref:Uncharacterized protein n=1 Tax=Edwardsiella tarda TaxID=636 RepID=A0A2S1PMM8_EDWTA|nr:hypothetical protein [Edwardsiella tarda]
MAMTSLKDSFYLFDSDQYYAGRLDVYLFLKDTLNSTIYKRAMQAVRNKRRSVKSKGDESLSCSSCKLTKEAMRVLKCLQNKSGKTYSEIIIEKLSCIDSEY